MIDDVNEIIRDLDRRRRRVLIEAEREAERIDDVIGTYLERLTTAQLLEYAGDCDVELDDTHCWRCRAWYLYLDRPDHAS